MPPVRRKKTTARQRAENVNEPSLDDLRQQCPDKGLSDQGRKNTLFAQDYNNTPQRLRQGLALQIPPRELTTLTAITN